MKCSCCDRRLSDFEATRKHKDTGAFLDLCSGCLSSVLSMASFEYTERSDLRDEYLSDEEGDEPSELDIERQIGYDNTLEGDY